MMHCFDLGLAVFLIAPVCAAIVVQMLNNYEN